MMTSRKSDKFMLRMPDGLRDKLKELSEQNRRSMNSQILTMLESQMREVDLDAKLAEFEHNGAVA